MASTYSGGVGKLQLITDGEQSGTWGQITNANLQVIEEMVSGLNTHDVAGSATTTLSGDSNVGSSYSASESKVAIIKLTGAVTGAHDVVAPAEEGWYIVWDASSGDYDLTFKPSGGTGVVVPRGGKTIMFTDGSTMYNLLAEANSLTEINDADNNEIIKFAAIASAVNEITVTNNATGSGPTLSATGGDTNIDINITPKGTGEVNISKVDIDSGTITGITDLAVADGGTGASTLTDGGVLLGSGTSAITAMAVLADGEMIVGDGTGDPVAESGATLRTSIGVAIGTDVQAYDADTAKTDTAQNFTAGQRGEITALTDGATITPDCDDSNNFSVTLGGNRTLANPSNITAGQSGSIFVTQDGTGSRTLSFGSYWDFAGGTAPTLTTTASAVDRIDYVVRSTTSIHAVATLALS